jgi:hypothetical protein
MSRKITIITWAFGVCICFLASTPETVAASPKAICPMNQISKALNALENEPPGLHRYKEAGNLALSLKNSGSLCVTSGDVKILTRLLRDKDDSMRYWAAGMIGNIGLRARSTIPALRAALAERPCLGNNSALAIRIALRKLGENLPRAPC